MHIHIHMVIIHHAMLTDSIQCGDPGFSPSRFVMVKYFIPYTFTISLVVLLV